MPLLPATEQRTPFPPFVLERADLMMQDYDLRPVGARWVVTPVRTAPVVIVATATPGGFAGNGELDALAFGAWIESRPASKRTVREMLDAAGVTWTYRLLPDESLASYAAPSSALECLVGLERARLGGAPPADEDVRRAAADSAFLATALAEGPGSLLQPLYARLFPPGHPYAAMGTPLASKDRGVDVVLTARRIPAISRSVVNVLGDIPETSMGRFLQTAPDPESSCRAGPTSSTTPPYRGVDDRTAFARQFGHERVVPPPPARGPLNGGPALFFGWTAQAPVRAPTLTDRFMIRLVADEMAGELAVALHSQSVATPGTSGCRPVIGQAAAAIACWTGVKERPLSVKALEKALFPLPLSALTPEQVSAKRSAADSLLLWTAGRTDLDLRGDAPNRALYALRYGGLAALSEMHFAVNEATRDSAGQSKHLEEFRRPPDAVVFSASTAPGAVLPVWMFP